MSREINAVALAPLRKLLRKRLAKKLCHCTPIIMAGSIGMLPIEKNIRQNIKYIIVSHFTKIISKEEGPRYPASSRCKAAVPIMHARLIGKYAGNSRFAQVSKRRLILLMR